VLPSALILAANAVAVELLGIAALGVVGNYPTVGPVM